MHLSPAALYAALRLFDSPTVLPAEGEYGEVGCLEY